MLIEHDQAEAFMHSMECAGFDVELGEGYAEDALNSGEHDRFQSYRLEDTNLIVTIDPNFYERFLAATSVAKRLNIMCRDDRVALFQAVLYANPCYDQFAFHAPAEQEHEDPDIDEMFS